MEIGCESFPGNCGLGGSDGQWRTQFWVDDYTISPCYWWSWTDPKKLFPWIFRIYIQGERYSLL